VAGSFKDLEGVRLRNLQEKFAAVKLIMIDEASMLSLPLLGKIDRRLRQAKNPEEILGVAIQSLSATTPNFNQLLQHLFSLQPNPVIL